MASKAKDLLTELSHRGPHRVLRGDLALVGLPEVVKGALFARYSRSAKSLRRLYLDEFAQGPDSSGGPAPSVHDDILIEELELGVRSYNCLKRAGIQTVGDLISKSEAELNAIPNFGKKSIDEVIETLHARGLSLRQD